MDIKVTTLDGASSDTRIELVEPAIALPAQTICPVIGEQTHGPGVMLTTFVPAGSSSVIDTSWASKGPRLLMPMV